jgi:hypothetical protein
MHFSFSPSKKAFPRHEACRHARWARVSRPPPVVTPTIPVLPSPVPECSVAVRSNLMSTYVARAVALRHPARVKEAMKLPLQLPSRPGRDPAATELESARSIDCDQGNGLHCACESYTHAQPGPPGWARLNRALRPALFLSDSRNCRRAARPVSVRADLDQVGRGPHDK